MKSNKVLKIILAVSAAVFTVSILVFLLVPVLEDGLLVEVAVKNQPVVTQTPVVKEPESVLVTAIYQMEENSKEIEAVYIEVFRVENGRVYYMEVPVDTQLTLSAALYKSLQTYSPELPQYLKVSNMAEGFSKEYGLTACNRMLSELLGVSITHYVRAEKKTLETWLTVIGEDKTSKDFCDSYTAWMESSSGDLTAVERWVYFESYLTVTEVVTETAPGSQGSKAYTVSAKQSRERLESEMYD